MASTLEVTAVPTKYICQTTAFTHQNKNKQKNYFKNPTKQNKPKNLKQKDTNTRTTTTRENSNQTHPTWGAGGKNYKKTTTKNHHSCKSLTFSLNRNAISLRLTYLGDRIRTKEQLH